MGYLTKEAYEGKEEWARKRMEKNKEITTLTEEQHDALAEICRLRHKGHCAEEKVLFCSQYPEHTFFWSLIDTENETNPIKELIKENNLPEWNWKCDGVDYPTDFDIYEIKEVSVDGKDYEITDEMSDEEKYRIEEECLLCLGNLQYEWNRSIEKYLRKIDEEHGTNYCPSGATRVW